MSSDQGASPSAEEDVTSSDASCVPSTSEHDSDAGPIHRKKAHKSGRRRGNARIQRRSWNEEALERLARLHAEHGSKWTLLASHFPGRSDSDVKNIFNSAIRSKSYQGRCLLRAYAQAVVGRVDDPDARAAAIKAAEKLRDEEVAATAAAAAAKALAADMDLQHGSAAAAATAPAAGRDALVSAAAAGSRPGGAAAGARTSGSGSAGAGRRGAAAPAAAGSDSPFAQHLPPAGAMCGAPAWAMGQATGALAQQQLPAGAAALLSRQPGEKSSSSGAASALSGRTPSGRRRLRPTPATVDPASEPQPTQQQGHARGTVNAGNGSTFSSAGLADGAPAFVFAKAEEGATTVGTARSLTTSAVAVGTQLEFGGSTVAALSSGGGEAAGRKVRTRIAGGGAPSAWGNAGLDSTASPPVIAAPVVPASAQPGVLPSSGTSVHQVLAGGPARFSDPGLTSSRLFGRSVDGTTAIPAAAAYLSAAGIAAAPSAQQGKVGVGKRASDSATACPAFSYPRQLLSGSGASNEMVPGAAGGMLGSPAFAAAQQLRDSAASTRWTYSLGNTPVTNSSTAPLFAAAAWQQQYSSVPAAASEQSVTQAQAQLQLQLQLQHSPWQLHSSTTQQQPGAGAAAAVVPPSARASCSSVIIDDSCSGVMMPAPAPQPYFRSGSGGRLGMSGLLVMLDAHQQPGAAAAPDNPDAMLEAYRDAAWLQPPAAGTPPATAVAAATAAWGGMAGGATQHQPQGGASPQLAAASSAGGFSPPLQHLATSDTWQRHAAPHQQQQLHATHTHTHLRYHTQPTWLPAQPPHAQQLHAASAPSLVAMMGSAVEMAPPYLQGDGAASRHPHPLQQPQQLPHMLTSQLQLDRQLQWTGGLAGGSTATDQLHSGSRASVIAGTAAATWARSSSLEAGSPSSYSLRMAGVGGSNPWSSSCLAYSAMEPELLLGDTSGLIAAGRVGAQSADGSSQYAARPAGAAGGRSAFSGDANQGRQQPAPNGGVRRDSGLGNPAVPQPYHARSLRRCSTQTSPPDVVSTGAAAVQPSLQPSVASAPASAAYDPPVGVSGSGTIHALASFLRASACTRQTSQRLPGVGSAAAPDQDASYNGGPSGAGEAAVVAAGAAVAHSCLQLQLHRPEPPAHVIDENVAMPGLDGGTDYADAWATPLFAHMDCSGDGGTAGAGGSHSARAAMPQLLHAPPAGAADGEGQGVPDIDAWLRAGRSEVVGPCADQLGWAELYGSLARFGGGTAGGDGDILMRDSVAGGGV